MKAEAILWAAACVILVAAYVASVPRVWQCEGVDEIDYLSVAHSLAIGKGYTVYGTPHVLYPPLYPSVLALIYRLAGVGAWRTMYTVNAVLGACGWILIANWMRRRFAPAGKWAGWFLLSAYYPWSFSCRYLMSEPLFLPVGFGLLILSWRVLERNGGAWWEYAGIAILSLLAGMTRAAAVALNGALVFAGAVRWLTSRKRAGGIVAALALMMGVGFFAYWSVRADIVNPDAPESHWRWAKKYLGLSKETRGIIARGEEVTETSAVFHRRALFAAQRYGQFVTSVVRPPRRFVVVGLVLSALFLIGLARHMRSWPWSPLGWYTIVFLAMILKTTWLSNYLRFYIMIAPFLFLFPAEGMTWWAEQVWGARRRAAAIVSGVVLLAVVVSLLGGGADLSGEEMRYQQFVRGVFSAGCLAAWALLVWAWRDARAREHARFALAALIVAAAVHSGALAALRARRGWNNSTLVFRRLEGVVHCARWLRETGCGAGALMASLPQVPSFLSGCVFHSPNYDERGRLVLRAGDRVMIIGMLHEVPFFNRAKEKRLMEAAALAEREGRLATECSHGQTLLYRVVERPAAP